MNAMDIGGSMLVFGKIRKIGPLLIHPEVTCPLSFLDSSVFPVTSFDF